MKARHFAAIIAATILTCAFVWTRLQIVSIGYDINELNRRERQVRDECNDLALQINEAKSPRRLEQIARTRLNMEPPRPGQSVRL